MNKLLFVTLIIALAGFTFKATAKDNALDCNNAMTTLEMNQCATIGLTNAEAELATYLKASLSHHAADAQLVKAINTAQQDWQRYLDSHCGAVYTQWRDGSIRGLMATSCKTLLTKQRTYDIWKSFLTTMDGSAPLLPKPSLD